MSKWVAVKLENQYLGAAFPLLNPFHRNFSGDVLGGKFCRRAKLNCIVAVDGRERLRLLAFQSNANIDLHRAK